MGDKYPTNYDRVKDAITRLNWHYGKGNVSNIRMYADGGITFDQAPYGCKPEERIGRINGNTVFALRHQRTISLRNRLTGNQHRIEGHNGRKQVSGNTELSAY